MDKYILDNLTVGKVFIEELALDKLTWHHLGLFKRVLQRSSESDCCIQLNDLEPDEFNPREKEDMDNERIVLSFHLNNSS